MTRTVVLEITESEVKRLEDLLEDFSATMRRIEANEPARQERMTRLTAEIDLLQSQAEKELEEIKRSRLTRPKMLWEK